MNKSVQGPFGRMDVTADYLPDRDYRSMHLVFRAEKSVTDSGISLRHVAEAMFQHYDGFSVVEVTEQGRRVVVSIEASLANAVRPLSDSIGRVGHGEVGLA